jgi:hypothetical protein
MSEIAKWYIGKKREYELYEMQVKIWRTLNRPKKCLQCLKWLNYCGCWETGYNCTIRTLEQKLEGF